MHYLGADIGFYDNLDLASNAIQSCGGNIIQIFTIPRKKYLDMYMNFRNNNKNIQVVIHASYTYNFCRDWDSNSWWIHSFLYEVRIAEILGVKYIVLHFGKSIGQSMESAYNNMYTSLLYVNSKILNNEIQILLETPAGQGSEICYTLEELARFYNKIQKSPNKEFSNRIKICIDTCHIYAANYDLNDEEKIKEYFKKFDENIGISNVKLVHLNDSKYKLGCRIDRHASLNEGYIGISNITYIYRFIKKLGIPIILETPGDSYKEEIKKLLFSQGRI